MQYRVDKYLPKAFESIQRVKVGVKTFLVKEDTVPKEYKGYISSLGANMIQAGVKTALTFYESEESGSKNDKRLINAAIKYIISDANSDEYSDYKLSDTLNNLSPDECQSKAEQIMDAATALKLALRTYKME
jgi:CRISPR-associated protein Cmr5